MGWAVNTRKQSKKAFINEVVNDYGITEYSIIGNHMWTVKNGTITLFLLRQNGGCWGVKLIDEWAHPYYYTCPKKYLKQTTVTCQEWRNGVMKYHRTKNAKIEVGRTYATKGCKIPEIRIIAISPRLLGQYGGIVYRVPRKILMLDAP